MNDCNLDLEHLHNSNPTRECPKTRQRSSKLLSRENHSKKMKNCDTSLCESVFPKSVVYEVQCQLPITYT